MANPAERTEIEIVPGVPAGERVRFHRSWPGLTPKQRTDALKTLGSTIAEIAKLTYGTPPTPRVATVYAARMTILTETYAGLMFSGPIEDLIPDSLDQIISSDPEDDLVEVAQRPAGITPGILLGVAARLSANPDQEVQILETLRS